jgi:NADH-quinone oxidoreductase subunit E
MKPLLSEQLRSEIDHWATRFPPEQKQSALLKALLLVQENHEGWLSDALIEAVADHLGLPHIAAYEVASFYSMYNLKPIGKYRIDVCTNISCLLSGADKIVEHLKKQLGVEFGETTADGKFTLKEVECLAACAAAPVCQIGRHYHEHLTPAKCDQLLHKLRSTADGK